MQTSLLTFTSRPYEDQADLLRMQHLLMQARYQTSTWQVAHIGELVWNFFQVAIHLEPTRFIRLWFAGDALAGFAMLGEDPSFDVQVHPRFAWLGIEQQALDWAETCLGDLRQADPGKWQAKLVTGSREDQPARRAFLEANGFHLGGDFSEVNMLRPLDTPIPTCPVPAGFQVRLLSDEDTPGRRAAIQREVWHPWSVGDLSDADYELMMQLPGYQRELDIVAVAPGGQIVSYVNGWNDPLNKVGDLGPLGAHPDYRRQGLTRAVIYECLRAMQAQGMQQVVVSTGVNNLPAQKLYGALGFCVVNRYLEYIKD